jgi:hypothetical protein
MNGSASSGRVGAALLIAGFRKSLVRKVVYYESAHLRKFDKTETSDPGALQAARRLGTSGPPQGYVQGKNGA